MLYLHGGGYGTGSSRGYSGFVGMLANLVGAPAFVPDYRLAPEAAYPAAVEDAVVAFRGLTRIASANTPIAVVGESAGAGLSLALAVSLRDSRDLVRPAVLGILCPWLDLAADLAGTRPFKADPLASPAMARLWAEAYIGSSDPTLPLISPLNCDLLGLPRMFIQSSSDDLFAPDAEELARLARKAGVEVDFRSWSGLWHGFQLQAAAVADARAALSELGRALANSLTLDS